MTPIQETPVDDSLQLQKIYCQIFGVFFLYSHYSGGDKKLVKSSENIILSHLLTFFCLIVLLFDGPLETFLSGHKGQ